MGVWLAGPCLSKGLGPLVLASESAVKVPAGLVARVGRTAIDPSHQLVMWKGVYFCLSCGCRAGIRVAGLADECKKIASRYGALNLRGLLRGIMPVGVGLPVLREGAIML